MQEIVATPAKRGRPKPKATERSGRFHTVEEEVLTKCSFFRVEELLELSLVLVTARALDDKAASDGWGSRTGATGHKQAPCRLHPLRPRRTLATDVRTTLATMWTIGPLVIARMQAQNMPVDARYQRHSSFSGERLHQMGRECGLSTEGDENDDAIVTSILRDVK